MKTLGIIAEFNPVHNGHSYLINEAKKMTGADAVVVVMSGNFTQRGECAVCDAHLRSRMALNIGADVIIKLPVHYSTGSAEFFASGAIALLSRLNCIDYLCFGSESGDITLLNKVADLLINETETYKELLKGHMKSGLNYPTARALALKEELSLDDETASKLSSSNDILGIEYLKALKRRGDEHITPITVKRSGAEYLNRSMTPMTTPSALAVREVMATGDYRILSDKLPGDVFDSLAIWKNSRLPVFTDDFSQMLNYTLLSKRTKGFASYFDVNENLSNRIENNLDKLTTFSDFAEIIRTKNTTLTHINRALIHILLGIKRSNVEEYVQNDFLEYAHVTGLRRSAHTLIKTLSESADLTFLDKSSEYSELLSPLACRMFEEELFSSELYNSVVATKFRQPFRTELSIPLEID